MKIDLTEEEREFLLKLCTRARFYAMIVFQIKHLNTKSVQIVLTHELKIIETLINKLSEKKCDIS